MCKGFLDNSRRALGGEGREGGRKGREREGKGEGKGGGEGKKKERNKKRKIHYLKDAFLTIFKNNKKNTTTF